VGNSANPIVGGERELAAIDADLAQPRALVVPIGDHGIGKTTVCEAAGNVATEVAWKLAERGRAVTTLVPRRPDFPATNGRTRSQLIVGGAGT
jgi:hypothetical protein